MARFSYVAVNSLPTSLVPQLPMTLALNNRSLQVTGLLDSGATVNVLPYQIGRALGGIWGEQTTSIPLAGNLGQFEARALVVMASHVKITSSNPVRLVFAWTRAENVPLIFGQMNFFLEFDVCFYRSQSMYEVNLKASS